MVIHPGQAGNRAHGRKLVTPALTTCLSSVKQMFILECCGPLQQFPEEGVVKERAQPLPSWTERGRKGIRMSQKVRQPADENKKVTFSTWQMPCLLGNPFRDLRAGVPSLRESASAPVVGGR